MLGSSRNHTAILCFLAGRQIWSLSPSTWLVKRSPALWPRLGFTHPSQRGRWSLHWSVGLLRILRWRTFMFRPPWQPPSPRGLPSAVLKGVECVGVGRAPICRQRLRCAHMGRRCAPTPHYVAPSGHFQRKVPQLQANKYQKSEW